MSGLKLMKRRVTVDLMVPAPARRTMNSCLTRNNRWESIIAPGNGITETVYVTRPPHTYKVLLLCREQVQRGSVVMISQGGEGAWGCWCSCHVQPNFCHFSNRMRLNFYLLTRTFSLNLWCSLCHALFSSVICLLSPICLFCIQRRFIHLFFAANQLGDLNYERGLSLGMLSLNPCFTNWKAMQSRYGFESNKIKSFSSVGTDGLLGVLSIDQDDLMLMSTCSHEKEQRKTDVFQRSVRGKQARFCSSDRPCYFHAEYLQIH